jgi:hypothetical protein
MITSDWNRFFTDQRNVLITYSTYSGLRIWSMLVRSEMTLFTYGKACSLSCAILVVASSHCSGEIERTIPDAEIDKAVISALSHQGAAKPKVISHIDLSRPFGTETQWTYVAVQETQPSTEIEEEGPLHVCLVKAQTPDCTFNFYQQGRVEQPPFNTPYHLLSGRVVYAGRDQSSPYLFLQICTAQSFNGNCGVATVLYRYERAADRFVRVFENLTGRNNNEATRFVERGLLQGDVIVDYPTENAPFTYWIEVYRPDDSGHYARILRYRGRTGYGDGNPLAVADSEMPAILSKLALWKLGEALPVPPHMPKGCSRLYMQRDEEWCK